MQSLGGPPKKQLKAGRPKKATNFADPAEITQAKVPEVKTTGELPKKIIGSHMGSFSLGQDKPPAVTQPKLGKGPSGPRTSPRKTPPPPSPKG